MNGYRILTVMKEGAPAILEITMPSDLNAIDAFRIVVREHAADIISAHLFRFNAGKWQHMMRKA